MYIAVLVGSLRADSYNRKLFNACVRMFPEIAFREIPLTAFPLYNADKESSESLINTYREVVANASGVLVISPEYNRSIPGGLKNALDWLSTGDVSFIGIPALVMGVTTGGLGTANAQSDIRKVLLHLGFGVIGQPEVYVSNAASVFDTEGKVTNEKTLSQLKKGIVALLDSAHRTTI